MAKGLIVRFYLEPVHMTFLSEKENRPIWEDREFVEIIPIGDNKTTTCHEATQVDKDRWPDEYARFKRGEQDVHTGTPLKEWSFIRPSQVKMLNFLNIFTVEHLAQCGDDAIQRMGPGARELTKQAQGYLDRAKDGAVVNHYAAENERMKTEMADMKATIAALSARLDDGKGAAKKAA